MRNGKEKYLLAFLDEEWDESVGILIPSLFYKCNGIVII